MSLYHERDIEGATSRAVSFDINRDYIKSLCLAGILTILLFIMGLAIALVALRPAPVIPESNTVSPQNGPALAGHAAIEQFG
ncbi:MAG: hypothetical protein R3F48_07020 [Candidatus Zixiibacteriota bacterium]